MEAILALSSVLVSAHNLSVAPLDLNEWWGPKTLMGYEDTSVRPAQIHFDDEMIKDLQDRLRKHVPFQPALKDSAFTYGFNSDSIEYWLNYWAEKYPFKEREAYLNQFPQFKTNIQGLGIHFIRVKPQPTVRKGLGATQIAVIMSNLMHRLGFERFYVQGGDWGGFIGSNIATIFPNEVLGFHTNWALVLSSPQAVMSLLPSTSLILEETGYFHIAATKPETIGIALTDSPAGLLAFILEKFSTGVTPFNRQLTDGGLCNTFAPETLIDDVMFYWTTRSMATSLRIYAETFNKKYQALGIEGTPTTVPTWVTQGKFELSNQPENILKTKYQNLLNATSLDFGGHFLAMEHPIVFSENVLTALKAFRIWHQTQLQPTVN